MSKIIPMMFCFDKNYVIPAAVAFYSLLENNEKEAVGGGVEFKLYVVHKDIPIQDQKKLQDTIKLFSHFATLEFIDDKSKSFTQIWTKIQNNYHFSQEIFYKLATPSIFPQYDKIIISDVDVVFLGSIIKEFEEFDTNQEYLIGGVVSNNPEAFFPIPKKGYRSGYSKFNDSELKGIQYGCDAAYLIVNIKEWKKRSIEEQAMQYLQKNIFKLILPEQDILSIVCYPYIKKISMSYVVSNNASEYIKVSPGIYSKEEILQAFKKPIQIHYSGGAKPWNTPSEPKSEIWFSYLAKTQFLGDFLNKIEDLILQKHYRASWKYQFHKILKNPKILLQPSTYKKVLDKLF